VLKSDVNLLEKKIRALLIGTELEQISSEAKVVISMLPDAEDVLRLMIAQELQPLALTQQTSPSPPYSDVNLEDEQNRTTLSMIHALL
jgi:hypothetical protein